MIYNCVTHKDLISLEPSLEDLKFNEEIDFDVKIKEAKRIMIADYKNNGKELKKIGVALSIPTDESSTGIDNVERLRIIIKTTSITGVASGVLSGRNDSSEDWTEIEDNIQITKKGDITFLIEEPYYYYKLVMTGTITWTGFIVDDVHELVWKYLAISLIFRQNKALSGDVYGEKGEMYQSMYSDALQRTIYSYDENLDGTIDEDENIVPRVRFEL